MPLNSGDLTERIAIQRRAAGKSALGQSSGSWVTYLTCWASAEPLRGREYFAAGQTQSDVDVRFRVRWREGLLPTDRVMWRNVPHDIVSIIEPKAGREALELMCRSGPDGR